MTQEIVNNNVQKYLENGVKRDMRVCVCGKPVIEELNLMEELRERQRKALMHPCFMTVTDREEKYFRLGYEFAKKKFKKKVKI